MSAREWFSMLNKMMIEEQIKISILSNYLLIDIKKNEYQFTCCEEGAFWICSQGEYASLPLKNPPLGIDPDAAFNLAVKPWNPEEELALAFHNPAIFKNKGKTPFTIISLSSNFRV